MQLINAVYTSLACLVIAANCAAIAIKTLSPVWRKWSGQVECLPWILVRLSFLLYWLVDKLPDHAVPPPYRAFDLCIAFARSHVVFALVELRIPDLLKQQPMNCSELAAAIPVSNMNGLERLLDTAVSIGLLRLVYDKRRSCAVYQLSRISTVLCSDHPKSVQPLAALFQRQSRPWYHLSDAIRNGGVPFEIQSGGTSYWKMLEGDPGEAAVFNHGMVAVNNLGSVAAVLADFPWEQRFDQVIDVGGGLGSFLLAMMEKFPKMRGALIDLPHTTAAAEQHWSNAHPELMDKISFHPGSFFDELPVTGHSGRDAFVLRNILHDWDDDDSAKTLRRIRAAIGDSQATLLIVEMALVNRVEATMAVRRVSDLHMLVMLGGKERTEQQFKQLLSSNGFKLVNIHTTRSLFFVIEAAPI